MNVKTLGFGSKIKGRRIIKSLLKRKHIWPILAGLLLTVLFFFAKAIEIRPIERLSDLLFDSYQRSAPREYLPGQAPVRIIDIDNESIARLGQWPWPRSLMAKLNDRLNEAGAGVISYDVIFSEPDRTSPENIANILASNPAATGNFENVRALTGHDAQFAQSLGNSNSVLGFFLLNTENDIRPKLGGKFSWGGSGGQPSHIIDGFAGSVVPLPELEAQTVGEGFVSFNPKGDGIIRQAPLIYRIGDDYYRSLSLETLRAALRLGAIKVHMSTGNGEMLARANPDLETVSQIHLQQFSFPTLPDGSFRVYFSDPKPERYIPAWQILDENIPMASWADGIAGHIVFVGTGADGLKDLVSTPIRAREPGVLVHAQIVEQSLGGQFLRRTYKTATKENFILVFAGLILAFSLSYLNAGFGALLSAALAAAIYLISWMAFKEHQELLSPIYALLAVLSIYVVMTLISFYMTETERSQIRNAFSMYLSPKMVKKVSENPALLALGGEERNMTILFLDIRSFSRISESMRPQEITTFLNLFLTPMTNILQASQATIDKYIGDAIVAFWNAPLDDPKHEANAARAVMDMHAALTELNAKYEGQTEVNWPDNVSMGVGLNTGICCVGNLGSEQRFSYSMIGDAANLASRIEGLTKQYKVSTLVGHETSVALDNFALLEADKIRVVGRQTPEKIYILAGDEKLAKSPEFKSLKDAHNAFLLAHRSQDWATAISKIETLKTLAEPFDFSGYYDVMMARIEQYKTNPPPKDWGGVFEATSK